MKYRENKRFSPGFLAIACALAVVSCRNSKLEEEYRAGVRRGMKRLIVKRLDEWQTASRDLEAAAPTPVGRGWDSNADTDAISSMKRAWARGRTAYELIEGAIAPTFPESDTATDARYDDFMTTLGARGDADPFDEEGVVGMHAIERILWANAMPVEAANFERGLRGYRPAAFPASQAEAERFKHGLAARLVRDVERLRTEFGTLDLDIAFTFRGLIDLAAEQAEKVDRAATGQEESRYARATMRDLRANHQGCVEAYELFRPWVLAQSDGARHDSAVRAGFERLKVAYAAVSGDSIPLPPTAWSGVKPTAAELETPFGRLFSVVKREADDAVPKSLHASLIAVAKLLGLPDIVVR